MPEPAAAYVKYEIHIIDFLAAHISAKIIYQNSIVRDIKLYTLRVVGYALKASVIIISVFFD